MSEGAEIITWLPYWELLVDLLKGVAWPLALLIVAIWYSKEIRLMLARITKVSAAELELDVKQRASATPETLAGEDAIKSTDLGELTDPMLKELEKRNFTDLNALNIQSDTDKIAQLVRALSVQQLFKSFAVAYSNIFGSQISFLRELNARPIAMAQAANMLDETRKMNPALKDITLQDYLSYFRIWRLAEQQGDILHITETGKNFLKFLVDQGLSEDRIN
ncbi:hypothetical protein [Sulfitobacter geojensis]|uniref:hypothetical protein n=1 Tax=Sulfitobacter geojensis TaxID=1342299 RepID=UPI0036DD700E